MELVVKPNSSTKSKRNRRKFTSEFKAEAVRLTRDPGQTIAQVALDLGVADGVLRNWVKQSDAERFTLRSERD